MLNYRRMIFRNHLWRQKHGEQEELRMKATFRDDADDVDFHSSSFSLDILLPRVSIDFHSRKSGSYVCFSCVSLSLSVQFSRCCSHWSQIQCLAIPLFDNILVLSCICKILCMKNKSVFEERWTWNTLWEILGSGSISILIHKRCNIVSRTFCWFDSRPLKDISHGVRLMLEIYAVFPTTRNECECQRVENLLLDSWTMQLAFRLACILVCMCRVVRWIEVRDRSSSPLQGWQVCLFRSCISSSCYSQSTSTRTLVFLLFHSRFLYVISVCIFLLNRRKYRKIFNKDIPWLCVPEGKSSRSCISYDWVSCCSWLLSRDTWTFFRPAFLANSSSA